MSCTRSVSCSQPQPLIAGIAADDNQRRSPLAVRQDIPHGRPSGEGVASLDRTFDPLRQ
jgi:hypothetical protein